MTNYLPAVLDKALSNTNFREVLQTGDYVQTVLMSLLPGEDIGMETHPKNDQVLFCILGTGTAVVDGDKTPFNQGDMVFVRAGQEHNFLNSGEVAMKIITLYGPPDHKDGTVHATKADAQADENE